MVISIIVPIYNVEKELDRCVQSILNQTYKNLEIILVDDGSPDNCPRMCDEYAKKDHRVKVIHKENAGQGTARNVGLQIATGTYVMYVDSDDYIELDSCERLLCAMTEGIDFVVGSFKEITEQKVVYHGHTNIAENTVYSSRDFAIRSIQANEWYASPVISLYRRDFLIKNNLFFKKGIIFEDTHLLPKVFFAADKVCCISYPFYNYVIRQGSTMQSKNYKEKADVIVSIYNEWMEWFADIKDEEYRRYLYAVMLRFYMRNCRTWNIREWRIKGVGFWFAMKYALDFKERLKILAFTFMKDIYLRL